MIETFLGGFMNGRVEVSSSGVERVEHAEQ